MFAPYKKIGLMHFGLFLGALPIFIAAHSKIFEICLMIFLIFLKLAIELYTHHKNQTSPEDKLETMPIS
jgi:hypothetical protein